VPVLVPRAVAVVMRMSVGVVVLVMSMVMHMVVRVFMAMLVVVAMPVIGLRRQVEHVMGMLRVMMIMPAAAIRAVVVVVMRVVIMRVVAMRMAIDFVAMIVVAMIVETVSMPLVVVSVVVAVIMAMPMVVGPALRPEGPHDLGQGAALPAHHLGEHMVILDVNRVRRDLRRRVPVADMPGDAHQAQRVLGADFEQVLRGGVDSDQPTVLQLQRIALVQHGRLVEIQEEAKAPLAGQRDAAALAVLVVQRDGVGDPVRLDGGFADDGGGAQHARSFQDIVWLM
jgi:hypothetical protein